MTQPTSPPKVSDLGASLVRTAVATAVGTVIAYLAQKWNIVLDEATTVGVVQAFTAAVIAVYYLVIRLLESKWKGFGWFLGLAKQPKYVKVIDGQTVR